MVREALVVVLVVALAMAVLVVLVAGLAAVAAVAVVLAEAVAEQDCDTPSSTLGWPLPPRLKSTGWILATQGRCLLTCSLQSHCTKPLLRQYTASGHEQSTWL